MYWRQCVHLAGAEIGCGEIPGVVGGHTWPFEAKKSYRNLQDYSPVPKYYDAVKFDFSVQYKIEMYFNNHGEVKVTLPYFLH